MGIILNFKSYINSNKIKELIPANHSMDQLWFDEWSTGLDPAGYRHLRVQFIGYTSYESINDLKRRLINIYSSRDPYNEILNVLRAITVVGVFSRSRNSYHTTVMGVRIEFDENGNRIHINTRYDDKSLCK